MRAFECFYRLEGDTGPGHTAIVLVPDAIAFGPIGAIAKHLNVTMMGIKDFSSIPLNHLNTHVYKVS